MNRLATSEGKHLALNQLEWSPASFTVDDFLHRFSLPQIVKVNEGYYGDDEESSLGADQVLTLHLVKSTDKFFGHDYRGKEVNIPLNCPSKVEVRPSHLKDVYDSVDELCSVFPSYVRISQGYYSLERDEELLNVGDKLRLETIDKTKKGHELLVCINQNGTRVELPRDCVAGFQPLTDGKEYYVAEVAQQFTLPLYVQFVNAPVVGGREQRPTNEAVFNSSLGSIYLEKKYNEKLVIASTLSHDGRRTVVTFPRDMDIRITVCEDMLRNSTNYATICQTIHEGVDLNSFRHIDAYNAFKPRHSIKEYSYKELVTYAAINQGGEAPEGLLPRRTGSKSGKFGQASPEIKQASPEIKQKSPKADRASSEADRASSEDDRQQSEDDRQLSDVDRQSSEAGRPLTEVDRLSPETDRSSTEVDRTTSGLDRPSTANVAQSANGIKEVKPQEIARSEQVSGNYAVPVRSGGGTGKSSPRVKPKPPAKPNRELNHRKAEEKDKDSKPPKTDAPLEATTTDSNSTSAQLKGRSGQVAANVQLNGSCLEQEIPSASTAQDAKTGAPDILACSVKQVSDILRELGMAKYVVKFEAEMIDGEMLSCLPESILTADLGMTGLHVMKLKKYLQGWRPKV